MKKITLLIVAPLCLHVCADTARIRAYVIDEITHDPIPNIKVSASFSNDNGWKAWTESAPIYHDTQMTDVNGFCTLKGKTNIGRAGCGVDKQGAKYYGAGGRGFRFTEKNIFGAWQPDNLVATIRLQRVEHPIPLFVKRIELRDYERGIGGFDGTNSVLRFDLMKGDWLPPYGNGTVADMSISSMVGLTESERRFLPQEGTWGKLQFFNLIVNVDLNECDFLKSATVNPQGGIKIRMAERDGGDKRCVRVMGKKKVVDRHGDWRCERFNDHMPDRCYTFRIRTRRNDKGELVEAYYGKIYGDFEFEGDDKKGLIGVKFLYYLNPKPLDRNLEWDMKNNLCPNPGELGMRQP